MKNELGSIFIETERNDYTGGDSVRGRVVMDITCPVLCRGVRMRCTGLEKTYWSTGSGKNRRTYSQTIEHVKVEKLLFGEPPLGAMALMSDAIKGLFTREHYKTFQPGHYEWDFDFSLPENCPGDFETGGNTCIRYEITAYIDIPLAADFSETKRLTVFESFDLPPEQASRAENSKTFMLDSGELSIKAEVENNQYYPGDTVKGSFTVTNHSSKTISEITVGLFQKEKWIAHKSTREREKIQNFKTFTAPHIPQGVPEAFEFEFVIPEDTYCTLKYSSIVLLDYFVNINLDVPWAVDLPVNVPILILEEEGCPSGGILAAPKE